MGYGAGIASSIGELEHLMSDKARFQPFEPMADCDAPYPIQTVQECYRVTESFDKSLHDLEQYGLNVLKPITTTYNFKDHTIDYDRCIEGIETEDKGPKF